MQRVTWNIFKYFQKILPPFLDTHSEAQNKSTIFKDTRSQNQHQSFSLLSSQKTQLFINSYNGV